MTTKLLIEEERTEIRQRLDSMSLLASHEWLRHSANPFGALYLYYRCSTQTEWGELRVSEDTPPGFTLATNERMAPNWNQAYARQWVRQVIRRLPVIPSGTYHPDGLWH